MAYCSNAEVTAEFKKIDFSSANAMITTTVVDEFILEADALINSYVSQRYPTPVTTGEGLLLLKMFSRLLVADRIRKVLEVKDPKASESAQNPRGVALSTKDIMKALEGIANGDQVLVGVDTTLIGGAFASSAVQDGDKFTFEKDKENW